MRTREPEDGVILFLGTLEPRKNLDMLVTAYEALVARRPSAPPLVLAGRATPQAESLIERVRRSPAADRVRLPGYIHPDDRLDLFNSAIVFVLPSHHEGFGMPAIEAMTAGVPVIAADRGALPEALGGAGRLVDPERPDELAHALEHLLDHPDERRRMATDGRRQAEHYTWKDTARKYRQALSLAIEHRHARG
jgi:glycosyltransferase involved in cell wall biosynthesis